MIHIITIKNLMIFDNTSSKTWSPGSANSCVHQQLIRWWGMWGWWCWWCWWYIDNWGRQWFCKIYQNKIVWRFLSFVMNSYLGTLLSTSLTGDLLSLSPSSLSLSSSSSSPSSLPLSWPHGGRLKCFRNPDNFPGILNMFRWASWTLAIWLPTC